MSTSGVYISFETHIFAPPPFFRIIFFPLTHGLKTGVFSPKPIESSYFCKMKNIHPWSTWLIILLQGCKSLRITPRALSPPPLFRLYGTGCPNKHGNSVTNSILSLLRISIVIPDVKSHNIFENHTLKALNLPLKK